MLAEHDRVGVEPDGRRVHDLVGRALLEHAVLVDAGLVRERVAPDDRLVRLHRVAGQARDQAARARDLASCRRRCAAPTSARARVQQHHDLLERRVARALADAVDRALDLARAGLHARRTSWRPPARGRRGSGPTARRRAARAPARTGCVRNAGVLVGHRVADGVGDVDRRRALVDARSAAPRR